MCIFDFLSVSFLHFILLCLTDIATLCQGNVDRRLCQATAGREEILFLFYSILTAPFLCTYVVTILEVARFETVSMNASCWHISKAGVTSCSMVVGRERYG